MPQTPFSLILRWSHWNKDILFSEMKIHTASEGDTFAALKIFFKMVCDFKSNPVAVDCWTRRRGDDLAVEPFPPKLLLIG